MALWTYGVFQAPQVASLSRLSYEVIGKGLAEYT